MGTLKLSFSLLMAPMVWTGSVSPACSWTDFSLPGGKSRVRMDSGSAFKAAFQHQRLSFGTAPQTCFEGSGPGGNCPFVPQQHLLLDEGTQQSLFCLLSQGMRLSTTLTPRNFVPGQPVRALEGSKQECGRQKRNSCWDTSSFPQPSQQQG